MFQRRSHGVVALQRAVRRRSSAFESVEEARPPAEMTEPVGGAVVEHHTGPTLSYKDWLVVFDDGEFQQALHWHAQIGS